MAVDLNKGFFRASGRFQYPGINLLDFAHDDLMPVLPTPTSFKSRIDHLESTPIWEYPLWFTGLRWVSRE